MHVPPPIRALLRGAIDFAGLFPPAALAMPDAAARFAGYRASDDAWALGRFVVPAARLAELEEVVAGLPGDAAAEPWRLSALVGSNVAADAAGIAAAGSGASPLRVEALEARTGTADDVRRIRDAFPSQDEIYCEVPIDTDPRALVAAIRNAGMRAKIRTGGVTADAFPSSGEVARFLFACVELDVPFKATAGLHHPLRAVHALTYAANSPRGTMHGYLNVFLAAALLAEGAAQADVVPLLEERDPRALETTDEGIAWRGRFVSTAAMARSRARGITAFGSCSFREPLDDLAALPSLARTT